MSANLTSKPRIHHTPMEDQMDRLLARASLAAHQDPQLSAAAKFGLTTEFKALKKLSAHLPDWHSNDTQRLIEHLNNIHRLSPGVTHLIVHGLAQWGFLLPESWKKPVSNPRQPVQTMSR